MNRNKMGCQLLTWPLQIAAMLTISVILFFAAPVFCERFGVQKFLARCYLLIILSAIFIVRLSQLQQTPDWVSGDA